MARGEKKKKRAFEELFGLLSTGKPLLDILIGQLPIRNITIGQGSLVQSGFP